MTEMVPGLWSEEVLRGMRHLAKEAHERNDENAFGLDSDGLEWAILVLDSVVNRCTGGYFRDPLPADTLAKLKPLMKAAVAAGYNASGANPYRDE